MQNADFYFFRMLKMQKFAPRLIYFNIFPLFRSHFVRRAKVNLIEYAHALCLYNVAAANIQFDKLQSKLKQTIINSIFI